MQPKRQTLFFDLCDESHMLSLFSDWRCGVCSCVCMDRLYSMCQVNRNCTPWLWALCGISHALWGLPSDSAFPPVGLQASRSFKQIGLFLKPLFSLVILNCVIFPLIKQRWFNCILKYFTKCSMSLSWIRWTTTAICCLVQMSLVAAYICCIYHVNKVYSNFSAPHPQNTRENQPGAVLV